MSDRRQQGRPPSHPDDKARARLEEWLACAKWRVREPLGKISSVARDFGIGTHAVVDALRSLEADDLVHKQGRVWIAGPSPDSQPGNGPHSATILLLMNHPEEWSDLQNSLSQRLALRISMEANRAGFRFLPVLTGEDGPDEKNVSGLFPTGEVEIRQLVKALGSRYRGTLVLPLRRHLPGIDRWLEMLLRHNRPVVWIQDEDPRMSGPQSEHLLRLSYGDWARSGLESSAALAIRTLHALGHREAVMPCAFEEFRPWVEERIHLLREAAIPFGFEVHAHLAWEGIDLSDPGNGPLGACRWSQVKARMTVDDPVQRRELERDGVILTRALAEHQNAALLCPNDWLARRYWKILRWSGVDVPGRLSMLSFDNSLRLEPFPVSTIDFGFDELGYQAFHFILGDIPLRIPSSRVLAGTNRVVDNGSLGRRTAAA